MQRIRTIRLLSCVLCICALTLSVNAKVPTDQVDRLRQSTAVNIDEVISAQFPNTDPVSGFNVVDPYTSLSKETVRQWQALPGRETEVCAIRFTDTKQQSYQLRGFESPAAASSAGFIVTHQGRCGSCSTLRDLAVYLSMPDLTSPARQCARRFGLARKKRCFEEAIGFTPQCAESWAYNARHTKQQCLGTCMADYGFLNLLFHRYPGGVINESGRLRPCLQCDEEKSGPGFKYSAGRTRRNSGIASGIPRATAEMYPVDHSRYFH